MSIAGSGYTLVAQKRNLTLITPETSNNTTTNAQKKQAKKIFHYRTGFVRNSVAVKNRLNAYRTYGFIKATNTGTPFPRRADPLDSEMLTARLAATKRLGPFLGRENLKSSHSEDDELAYGSISAKRSVAQLPDDSLPRLSAASFEERRRLFDLAEFTICKGRKLSDVHHQMEVDCDTMHNTRRLGSIGNYSSFTSGRHYKEVEAFCLARNIQLNKGIEYAIMKRL